ncbi:hypothetical protein J2T57_002435 [Natronocella acetinitrilica]|uniref:Uncharacterized protein n=1 Tax=Natronocella acetinitrilica TaxID=414046 RepID=A0AAE3G4L6_9GAMM|nr:kinetochore protein SPC24 [Natronocella acetinitrilica]MCP1675287.1 hypothetical protein [Natronocella acetinitrilica]
MQTNSIRKENSDLERHIAHLRSTLSALESRLEQDRRVSGVTPPQHVPPVATAETPLAIAAG